MRLGVTTATSKSDDMKDGFGPGVENGREDLGLGFWIWMGLLELMGLMEFVGFCVSESF